jgi:alpha-tubulin suppressor-like RCC1 family protein
MSDQPLPTPVVGNLVFRQIAAGEEHTCGVTTDDRYYCWGLNRDGMVGPGIPEFDVTTVPVEVPVP